MENIKEATVTKNIVFTAMFIGIGIILPSIFHTANMAGNMFLPMHIPVLICAIVCGYKYGMICGFIVPIVSSVLTGMPPLFPVGIIMSLELACYGGVLGFLLKKYNIITSLILTLLAGRIVSLIGNIIVFGLFKNTFVFSSFIIGAFVTSIPGIIIQIVLIPLIYKSLKKRGFVNA
ncbi:MAG: ECF transporter S component [Clostridium sp.]|uniref:ECF transporter S component n=1 Tax=Clostridium sp. TaxID=1506 RepID=UPI003F3B61A4